MARRDEVRIVETSAIVGTGQGWAFSEGAVLVLAEGTAPDVLKRISRVHDGAPPVDAVRFDRGEFDRATRPEPPPAPPPKPITEDEIRATFGWGDAQWAAAQALGFPRATGQRLSGVRLFERARVNSWLSLVRLLNLGANDGRR